MFLKKIKGLTLIEVLIALAIVGIAITAVIKATSQNIRSTQYLQNKTMAMWVGKQVINEAQMGVITLPDPGDSLQKTTSLLGRDWYWQAYQQSTPNKRIQKILVQVYMQEKIDDETTPIISLESYLYKV